MSARGNSGFNRTTLLGLVLLGFAAFLSMLYFIGAGDTGDRSNNGSAHAAAKGLNGYAGLAQMLDEAGFEVALSRSPSGLKTPGLLVISPPLYVDPEEIDQILDDREYAGPTLVILPKWRASLFPPELPDEIEERLEEEIQDGWVQLNSAGAPSWVEELDEPYRFEPEVIPTPKDLGWQSEDLSGTLPDARISAAEPSETYRPLVSTDNGRALVLSHIASERDGADIADDEYVETWPRERIIVVVEPDLINNYGLADPQRAQLALQLFDEAAQDGAYAVTFDLTLNGLGATTNLLTLAFQPPFLAATLCLILAMFLIGWRAFKRFGPPVASAPAIAFGKDRLVTNGADLIIRAGRFSLLTDPYCAIARRRLAKKLGLGTIEAEAVDEALATRLGEPLLYSSLAQDLLQASSPSDIVRAARALKELEGQIAR